MRLICNKLTYRSEWNHPAEVMRIFAMLGF